MSGHKFDIKSYNEDVYEGYTNLLHAETLNGKIEVTQLNTASYYAYYLVYFFIAAALVGLVLNQFFNSDAEVLDTAFVGVGIVFIFLIAKWTEEN